MPGVRNRLPIASSPLLQYAEDAERDELSRVVRDHTAVTIRHHEDKARRLADLRRMIFLKTAVLIGTLAGSTDTS